MARRIICKPKICLNCKKNFSRKKYNNKYQRPSKFKKQQFCSSICAKKFRSGKNHPFWNGGFGTRNGYLFINKSKRLLHRSIIEEYLGRKLKTLEIVHHINGNIRDNKLKNLIITNHSEHSKFHSQNRIRNKIGRFL